MDGDGKLDIITASNNGANSAISILRNIMAAPGTINVNSFAVKVDVPIAANVSGLEVGDIDGDGNPDVAI